MSIHDFYYLENNVYKQIVYLTPETYEDVFSDSLFKNVCLNNSITELQISHLTNVG